MVVVVAVVLSRKLLQHLNNVWTILTVCGALTHKAAWHHGNRSLRHYIKQTLSVTLFLQCTLPDTNRVSVLCVCACNLPLSLLTSCAHSSGDLKKLIVNLPFTLWRDPHNPHPSDPIYSHSASAWFLHLGRKSEFNGTFKQLTSSVQASGGERGLEGGDLRSLLRLQLVDSLGFGRSGDGHVVGLRSGEQVLSILEMPTNREQVQCER